MGYIKKLKSNELVGGTDKHTIYPVTSTEAVFEEITNGNESSFKSQKTINKEQQDELDDHEERIQAAEAEDIKSITINGSTKEFRVDGRNNVDLTIYTVDNDPEMPSIASNVEDLRNMVGTSTPVLDTSHKTRIETLEGGESVTGSVENKIKTKVDSINSSYQDDNNEYVKYSMTQVSGKVTDFNIDETSLKNAITSLNTSISGDNIIVGPRPTTGLPGKIYRVVNSSNNTYTDYMYSNGSWIQLAIHDTSDDQAQVAYYTCIATGSGAQTTKQFVGSGSLTYTPSSGGHIKILMGEANTATGTIYLQYNTDATNTKKPLYYNGEPVSTENTWEAGETIAVYYDPSANSNVGAYFASNAQGGGGKAEKIKYDNSQSGLSANNVQEALDELGNNIYDYETINWVSQTTTLNYYINGSTGIWAAYSDSAKYVCRILPISPNTKYRLTAQDGHPINFALLNDNNPSSHVGEVATDWNNGIPKGISAGGSIVIDSGEYTFLYIRNNANTSSTDIKYPKTIEKQVEKLKATTDAIEFNVETISELIGVEVANWHVGEPTYEWSKGYVNAITGDITYSSNPSFWLNTIDIDGSIYGAIKARFGISAALENGTIFYDSDNNIINDYTIVQDVDEVRTYLIPANAVKIRIQCYADTQVYLYRRNSNVIEKEVTIPMDMGVYLPNFMTDIPSIVSNKLDRSKLALVGQNEYNFQCVSNSGFVKLHNGSYTIKCSQECKCAVVLCDDTRKGSNKFIAVLNSENNYSYTFESYGLSYAKICLFKDIPEGESTRPEFTSLPQVKMTGDFGDVLTAKLEKQASTPADKIMVPVWMYDYLSTKDSTTSMQDNGQLKKDWGLIQLPETYTADGEPVRLIIWCHGGTPRYNPAYSGQSGIDYGNGAFTSIHLTPSYFLKEGYAIMDMDGVWCINNDNDFGHPVPQIKSCYKAGYEWVLRNYNIRKDGVFLAGKSAGGTRALYLMQTDIPIIAVGLEVPFVGPSSVWQRNYNQKRLVFCGFEDDDDSTFGNIPISYNWCSINNYPNGADWDKLKALFKENYRVILASIPLLAWCNIPDSDALFEESGSSASDIVSFFRQPAVNSDVVNEDTSRWESQVLLKWGAKFPYPIKMWVGTNDGTADWKRHGYLMYKVGVNGGSDIELRVIDDPYADHSPSMPDAHTITVSSWVTKYGETLTDVPLVYAEMLNYFRRWEPLSI